MDEEPDRECEDCGDLYRPFEIPETLRPFMGGFEKLCPECLSFFAAEEIERLVGELRENW